MFTGLIQTTGRLVRRETMQEGQRFQIAADQWATPLVEGESIAVNGVCLTVSRIDGNAFGCEVLGETLSKTTLGQKRTGAILNLERALRAGDAMGGHIVSGHVDGTGTVLRRESTGRDRKLQIACSPELLRGIVPKGSITCDGISLTVASLADTSFTVHIIPYTWTHTALCDLRDSDAINLETDMIGKYVFRYMSSTTPHITPDTLRNAGF